MFRQSLPIYLLIALCCGALLFIIIKIANLPEFNRDEEMASFTGAEFTTDGYLYFYGVGLSERSATEIFVDLKQVKIQVDPLFPQGTARLRYKDTIPIYSVVVLVATEEDKRVWETEIEKARMFFDKKEEERLRPRKVFPPVFEEMIIEG